MTAYAIANLRPPSRLHDEVFQYMEQIRATLEPFDGKFLIHGAPDREEVEGSWPGSLVMIGFPTMTAAREWYESPAYQEIAPLRTRHIGGDLLLIDGVGPDYDPAATAAAFRAAQQGNELERD